MRDCSNHYEIEHSEAAGLRGSSTASQATTTSWK
jgi:hypothetical protein